jgi:hypothetical protein
VPTLVLGRGSPLLSVIMRILSARYRFIVNPGKERIVNYAPSGNAYPDAKIGIAGGYRIALSIEPSNVVEHAPTTGEKRTGNSTYLVHQQRAI